MADHMAFVLPFEVVADLFQYLYPGYQINTQLLNQNFKDIKTFENIFRFIGLETLKNLPCVTLDSGQQHSFVLPSENNDWNLLTGFNFKNIQALLGKFLHGAFISLNPYPIYAYKAILGRIDSNFEFFEKINRIKKHTLLSFGNVNTTSHYTISSFVFYSNNNRFECVLSIKDLDLKIFPLSQENHLKDLNNLFTNFTIRGILYEKTLEKTKNYFKRFYDNMKNNKVILGNKQIYNNKIEQNNEPNSKPEDLKKEGTYENKSDLKNNEPNSKPEDFKKEGTYENKSDLNTTIPLDSSSPILNNSSSIDLTSQLKNRPEEDKVEAKMENKKLDFNKKEEEKKLEKPELVPKFEVTISIEQESNEISKYINQAYLSAFSKKNIGLVFYNIKRRQNEKNVWECCGSVCKCLNPKYTNKCIRCGQQRK